MSADQKTCGNCRFWKFEGNLEFPARAGNEGICGWFLDVHRKGVPPWAEDLARATISFHGKSCRVWEKRKPAPTKVLAKKKSW